MGEISSLFLNYRWLLINTNRGDTPALTRTNYSFALTFFLFRVMAFWSGVLHVFIHELPFLLAPPQSAPAWSLIMLCSFLVGGAILNAFWLAKIYKTAVSRSPPHKLPKAFVPPHETCGLAHDGRSRAVPMGDAMSDVISDSEMPSPV